MATPPKPVYRFAKDRYECPLCGKLFRKREDAVSHIRYAFQYRAEELFERFLKTSK